MIDASFFDFPDSGKIYKLEIDVTLNRTSRGITINLPDFNNMIFDVVSDDRIKHIATKTEDGDILSVNQCR